MKTDRIYIMGPPGAGKSVFARKISRKINIKNYDLDDIKYREDKYKPIAQKKRNAKLRKILKKRNWIIEGSYASPWISPAVRKSTLVIILKPSRIKISLRIILRYLKRKCGFDKSGKGAGNVKDIIKLLGFAKTYPYNYFIKHQNLAKKNKKRLIILKNKEDIHNFLKEI